MTLKYLVDKALSPRTVVFLVKKGYIARRVNEVFSELVVEDEAIFRFAINNDYVIITSDLDFGKILAYTKFDKPSIIILRLDNPRVPNVNQILEKTLPLTPIQRALKEGSIVIINEKNIRVRKLPLI